jgi:hypothetical protein
MPAATAVTFSPTGLFISKHSYQEAKLGLRNNPGETFKPCLY